MPMITGFDAFISGVLLAAAQAPVAGCPAVPMPDIAVDIRRQDTKIDQQMSRAELAAIRRNTDLPYQLQSLEHIETGGMMHGDITVSYDIDMRETPATVVGDGKLTCVHYRKINVIMQLNPTIYIARDFAPGSCWYHEIREHEESHIDMDRVVIEKYARRIRDGLKMAFSAPSDNIFSPVNINRVADLKTKMGENVMAIVDVMTRDMTRERAEKQQGVDSLRGYAYITNTCYKGENVIHIDE